MRRIGASLSQETETYSLSLASLPRPKKHRHFFKSTTLQREIRAQQNNQCCLLVYLTTSCHRWNSQADKTLWCYDKLQVTGDFSVLCVFIVLKKVSTTVRYRCSKMSSLVLHIIAGQLLARFASAQYRISLTAHIEAIKTKHPANNTLLKLIN